MQSYAIVSITVSLIERSFDWLYMWHLTVMHYHEVDDPPSLVLPSCLSLRLSYKKYTLNDRKMSRSTTFFNIYQAFN